MPGTPRRAGAGSAKPNTRSPRALAGRPGDSLLDVGCGTGWFSRRAAADGFRVTGLDPNAAWLEYARAHASPDLRWVEGDARRLPFPDASFDHVLSIAALCFVDDERQAVTEIVRATRRRFAVGWLNRESLLYRQKGRHGGSGAYRGARWRNAREVRALFAGLPVHNLVVRSAVFLSSGGGFARCLERGAPALLPYGGLLLAIGEKT